MNRRCAGLVVSLMSLAALGIADAIDLYGLIDPKGHSVWVDTAIVSLPGETDTFLTPGWGSDSLVIDTFDFGYPVAWPTEVRLIGAINTTPNTSTFSMPQPGMWYPFQWPVEPAPMAMFYSTPGAAEPRPTVKARPLLSVSPCVVTSQMTVRVQATGNPVVEVLDAAGNLVRTLDCTGGTATWSREDGLGRLVPEGIYFLRHATSDEVAVRKVLVAH